MTKVVGIRFRNAGKIYYFDPLTHELTPPMHVIVETARGVEMGTVLLGPVEVEDDKVVQPLKPILRIATDEDEKRNEVNRQREKDAFRICKEKILGRELEMKLVQAEYTFDGNKLLFYFTADGRIDFRDLVKDLAAAFHTRIELRQIGVRDETKMLGGMGICGRELCCKSYLTDFVPVSIKMAKEQNLSLNPTKISGACGRLMCCLKNEQDTYEYLNSRLPSVGDLVTTPGGLKGEVSYVNLLRQKVRVLIDNGEEKELREYPVDELRFRPHRKRDVKLTDEELRELKELEDQSEDETKEKEKKSRTSRRLEKAEQDKNPERPSEKKKEKKHEKQQDKQHEKQQDKLQKQQQPQDKTPIPLLDKASKQPLDRMPIPLLDMAAKQPQDKATGPLLDKAPKQPLDKASPPLLDKVAKQPQDRPKQHQGRMQENPQGKLDKSYRKQSGHRHGAENGKRKQSDPKP